MSKQSNDPKKTRVSRREALVSGAALAAGATVASCLPNVDGDWPPDGGQALCSWTEPKITDGTTPPDPTVARVDNYDLVIRPPNVAINTGLRNPPDKRTQVEASMEEVLKRVTGETDPKAIYDPEAIWGKILPTYTAGQVVGIKVNVLNAKVPTHPDIVHELVLSLKRGGIRGEDILIWDRRLDELRKAGFNEKFEKYLGCKVLGTMDDTQSQGQGPGYEDDGICIGSQRARLTRLITRSGADGGIDHLINFAVLKNHLASGFTGVLKNHYGTIHNPGKFHNKVNTETQEIEENRFEQAIPTINALDEVRKKSRLHLMDASIVVIKGDTDSPPDWLPGSLLASFDPVALDARGRDFRNEMLVLAGTPSSETLSNGWLRVAEKVGLGTVNFKTNDRDISESAPKP